jgi:hypothetical protein
MNTKEKAIFNVISLCQGHIYRVMVEHDIDFGDMADSLLESVMYMLVIDAVSRLRGNYNIEDLEAMIEMDIKEKVYRVLHKNLIDDFFKKTGIRYERVLRDETR